MVDFDVGAIVPSTRDLAQVISTRRKNLALIAVIDPEQPAEEAARLFDSNISAFAFAEPGPALQLGARSTKTVPSLSLAPVTDRDGCLRARYFGADGVAIDASLPGDAWDQLAKGARTMRMLPLALANGAEGVKAAMKAGARALLIRAPSADELLSMTRELPRNVVLVAALDTTDMDALRKLAKNVDAAVVPPAVHRAPGFAELVAEVDP